MRKKSLQNIIATLLILIVAVPSLARAGEDVSNVHAIKTFNITAGQKTAVLIHGVPDSIIAIKHTNPYKKTIESKALIGSEGALLYELGTITKAGHHSIVSENRAASFTVKPAAPIATIKASDRVLRMDEQLKVDITLQDRFGNITPNVPISASANKGSMNIACTTENCTSNKYGKVHMKIRFTSEVGFKKLSFSNTESGTPLAYVEVGVLYAKGATPASNYNSKKNFDYQEQVSDYLYIENNPNQLYGAGNDESLLSDVNMGSFFTAQVLNEDIFNQDPILSTTTEAPSTTAAPSSTASVSTTAAPSTTVLPSTTATPTTTKAPSTTADPSAAIDVENGLKIVVEDDPVIAGLVPIFSLTRTDDKGETIENYAGTVAFSITPSGPQLPSNFAFVPEEHLGTHTFDISLLIQDPGTYILKAEDTKNASIYAEKAIEVVDPNAASTVEKGPSLSITYPITGSSYSGTFSVSGTSDKDVEIEVKIDGVSLGKSEVNATTKGFSVPVTIKNDGTIALTVEAKHIPTNTTTTTELKNIKIDTTPPVITSATVNPEKVQAEKDFTLVVLTEPKTSVTAFLNNKEYEFKESANNSYTLSLTAPTVEGTYAINIEVKDELGNADTIEDAARIEVTPGLPNIAGLIGIPGPGSIALTWEAIKGADHYQISYSEGRSIQKFTSTTNEFMVPKLSEESSYSFKVEAFNASNTSISKSASTISLTPQKPHAAAAIIQPPPVHTASGPEVYVFIALSVLFLNFYAKIRKSLA
jgi:hypothetical protein